MYTPPQLSININNVNYLYAKMLEKTATLETVGMVINFIIGGLQLDRAGAWLRLC